MTDGIVHKEEYTKLAIYNQALDEIEELVGQDHCYTGEWPRLDL